MPESFEFFNDHPLHPLVIAELWGDEDARKVLEADTANWIIALTQIIESCDVQFGARRASWEAYEVQCRERNDWTEFRKERAAYDDWRHRTNGFKRRVVQRQRAVKQAHKAHNVETDNSHTRERFYALRHIADIVENPQADPYADLEAISMIVAKLKEDGALA